MTLPRLLRVATLALLVVLVVVGIPSVPEEGKPTEPLVVSVDDDATWLRILRHGAEAPIHAVVPHGAAPPVTLELPQRLRADRPATLGVEAHRGAELTLTTPAGVSRDLSLGAGDRGAFLLRPREPGPARWELSVVGGPTESVAGWVEPPRPLRILALSGPPSPESRIALQALEESGEAVDAWIHLGRELWVGRDSGPLPGDPDAYAGVDLILLFPGLTLPEPVVEILRRRVEEEGMGFLVAGGPARWAQDDLLRSPTLVAGSGATSSATAESLVWTLPAEVSPLPPAELELRLHGEGAEGPLTLATAGRGRIGVLSIAESWRWRMEADEAEGHRTFWQSVASWLAGGVVHDPILEVAGDRVRVGEAVRIRILAQREARAPTHLVVTPPDGAPEPAWTLPLPPPVPLGSLHLQETRFVPFASGPYRLEARWGDEGGLPGGEAMGEEGAARVGGPPESGESPAPRSSLLVLDREAPELDVAGRLARLAVVSPGGGVRGESAHAPPPTSPPLPWALLLFGTLALLLTAEWLVRRLAGRP